VSGQVNTLLVRSGVEVLVTGGTPGTMTAKQAASTGPIVGISISNPVGQGLAQSLARRGGNVTGVSLDGTQTWATGWSCW
jgi:putative ABC transport system substrate-binding protein